MARKSTSQDKARPTNPDICISRMCDEVGKLQEEISSTVAEIPR
jgi:hypothetical protein